MNRQLATQTAAHEPTQYFRTVRSFSEKNIELHGAPQSLVTWNKEEREAGGKVSFDAKKGGYFNYVFLGAAVLRSVKSNTFEKCDEIISIQSKEKN